MRGRGCNQSNHDIDPDMMRRLSARRGWRVVAGAFVVMFVAFGVAYSFSCFFPAVQQTFQSSRAEIALIFSIGIPSSFLLGAVGGPLADRTGARFVSLGGVIVGQFEC
jgi:MFS transporter, OFA family, oxalate/formate antiporter